eukprot:jgi/Psemu1/299374/fgenesh1_pm.1334_\
MHAKRTRDRKRLFMEEIAEMCKVLEGENLVLQQHLNELNGVRTTIPTTTEAAATETIKTHTSVSSVPMVSPSLSPKTAPIEYQKSVPQGESVLPLTSQNGASFDQMKTLVYAAGVFDLNNTDMHGNSSHSANFSVASAVSVSSEDPTDHTLRPLKKRRQFNPCPAASSDEDGAH